MPQNVNAGHAHKARNRRYKRERAMNGPVTVYTPHPFARTVASNLANALGNEYLGSFSLQTNADGSVTVLNPGVRPRHGR